MKLEFGFPSFPSHGDADVLSWPGVATTSDPIGRGVGFYFFFTEIPSIFSESLTAKNGLVVFFLNEDPY